MLFPKATMVRVKEMNYFCRKDSEPKHTDGLQIGHSLDKEKDIKIACDVVHLKLFLHAGSDAAIP